MPRIDQQVIELSLLIDCEADLDGNLLLKLELVAVREELLHEQQHEARITRLSVESALHTCYSRCLKDSSTP